MHYAYLGASVIILTLWLILFNHRKDLHREMLIMSALAAPLGLFDVWFVSSYWQPITLFNVPVGIEGIVYSFSIGGIAAVLYPELAHRTPRHIHNWHKLSSAFVLLLTLVVFLLLKDANVPNPMVALYVALLAGIALLLYLRKDLVRGTIIGGLAFGVIYFCLIKLWITIFPGAQSWFLLEGLPKAYILGVPCWEVLFGIMFAAYWGNVYEALFGYRLVAQRHTTTRRVRKLQKAQV